jgi:autotransporter-associated beta strand protein
MLKGGSHTEVVSSTTLGHQTGNSISRDGGTSKISLGALTAPGGNNMHTLAISEANIATTTTANVNGILALGRVTVGSDFAANDGSGNIVAYTGYTAVTTAGVNSASVVHQLTGGGTMAAGLTSYALRIVNGGNSDVLDINSRNLAVTNNSTIFYAGGFDNNYTINGTTGSLSSSSGNQPFVINTYTGTTLTVNARVTGSLTNIQKAGEGTLVLGANSQFGDVSGPTVVQQGVLRLAHKDALGTIATGTVVQGGAALELSGGISDFAAEPITINGVGIANNGALRNHSGNNTFAGPVTIGASGARINANADTSLTLTGGITTTLTQDVTFGGAGNTTVSTTAISGSGSLIKDGLGILTLSSANTYTGATMVSNGTLVVNGSVSNSSLTTVASGATIGGSGTIGALTVSSGGFINPGNSPGILNTGDYVQAGTYIAEITGLIPGTEHDQINVTGTVDITGGSLTAVFSAGTYAANDLIFILLNDGDDAIIGTFTDLAQGATVTSYGGFNWNISYIANNTGVGTGTFTGGNDIALQAVVIPEPKAALLGAIGVLLLFRRRR